jgi:hypothetical protein
MRSNRLQNNADKDGSTPQCWQAAEKFNHRSYDEEGLLADVVNSKQQPVSSSDESAFTFNQAETNEVSKARPNHDAQTSRRLHQNRRPPQRYEW